MLRVVAQTKMWQHFVWSIFLIFNETDCSLCPFHVTNEFQDIIVREPSFEMEWNI